MTRRRSPSRPGWLPRLARLPAGLFRRLIRLPGDLIRGIELALYGVLEGDRAWGRVRWYLGIMLLAGFVLLGRITEQITPNPALAEQLGRVFQALPAGWQPWQEPANRAAQALYSLILPQTLRHALPAIVAFWLALRLGANYVRDLFELPAEGNTAAHYMMGAVFGARYPTATVSAGGFDEKDRDGALARIGGPGFVTVASGHAAVFERLGVASGVAAAGRHFMRRFEILRDVVDLRDQLRVRAEVVALTRDGIEVKVKDVQCSFRVRTGNRQRSSAEVYPFSTAAVARIVYDRVVGQRGPSQWTESVPNAVAGQIRDYIARHTLDELVQPEEGDVRERIRATFEDVAGRKRFASMGVELLWVGLGQIQIPQNVLDQNVRTWQAEWQRDGRIVKASGEAEKLKLMEYARALARLELIRQIAGTWQHSEEVDTPKSHEMVLLHFAEALGSTARMKSLPKEKALSDDRLLLRWSAARELLATSTVLPALTAGEGTGGEVSGEEVSGEGVSGVG